MKVAIYGAGAMGTILGAYCAKAGKPIDLISRNREHIEVLKKDGAHIIGKVDFIQKVSALLPEEMKEKYDLIFLMTKQRENKKIVTFLKDFLNEEGVICTMQNGLPEFSVAEIIGKEKTYGCAVAWGANFHGKGISELTTIANKKNLTFSFGSMGENKKIETTIQEYLNCMGMVEKTNNLMGVRWAKLTINSAFSGLSAITGLTFGEIARDKEMAKIAISVMGECVEVAKGANIKIEKIQGKDITKIVGNASKIAKWIALLILPIAMKKHKNLRSGMLKDLQEGKMCEIEYIDGVVKKYGDRYDVFTPYIDKIIEITHGIENKQYSIGKQNIKLFAI